MKKTQELNFEDRKQLYLEMMDEVDVFCRNNNIKYSLTCGTLIGAIRHNGFIPWDDDFDIAMPLPDMLRFKKEFHSENLRYVDIDIDSSYLFSFSRIESLKTYSKNYKSSLLTAGLSIDLYPILGLPKEDEEIDKFFIEARKICDYRLFIIRILNFLRKFIPIHELFFLTKQVKKYRNFMFQFPYDNSNRFYHFGGYPNWKAVQNQNFFTVFVDVDFEGRKYLSVEKYDEYLRNGYGDYMQLPPVDQRHPYHGGKYYWKE